MNMAEPIHKSLLDELLANWHEWQRGYSATPTYGACPVFKNARSPKHWDTTGEIDDAIIHTSTMEAIDFAVMGDKRGQGAMPDPYKTAICFYARNLSSRAQVWTSPRLPEDQAQRVEVTNHALAMLSDKLTKAGVI